LITRSSQPGRASAGRWFINGQKVSYGKSTLILFANRKHLEKAISWQPNSTKRIGLKWIPELLLDGFSDSEKSLANCLRFNVPGIIESNTRNSSGQNFRMNRTKNFQKLKSFRC
jgi:hypothetical protein